ncbi:lipase family protein [Stieleria sp. JC731]|uniref:lipase family protein n=1 Tax=Pirellulaceae TaxID=2691357 RepID=UPI001E3C25C4|nr:lipase family protein [Stieleria sp. JC731]MCC9602146.1 lipase family protein [Stieleria sp. JC731]
MSAGTFRSLLGKTFAAGIVLITSAVFGVGAANAQTKYYYPTFGKSYLPVVEDHAFDHFNSVDEGSDIVNRFLLAHLSMTVYNNTGLSEQDYDDYLDALYANHGVLEVQGFHDSNTGADGAIFVTEHAVIVACRGTSGSITNLADHYADLDRAIKLVKVDNTEVGVHRGFWNAATSVFPEVVSKVALEVSNGRRVWLTGHSLGGATASMLAFKLQYQSGIPVQGLMTYGAPRVGDTDFNKMIEQPKAGGRALTQSTQRFVLAGDVAATFWNDGNDIYKKKHVYHHFGKTHTIFKESGQYNFDYFSGELPMGYIPRTMIPYILTYGIHMEYESALFEETAGLLLAVADEEILEDLIALP